MILLVGPLRWQEELRRLLTDRTNHEFRVVTELRDLRGVNENIEIVICDRGWEPNQHQLDIIAKAKRLNELRNPAIDKRT